MFDCTYATVPRSIITAAVMSAAICLKKDSEVS